MEWEIDSSMISQEDRVVVILFRYSSVLITYFLVIDRFSSKSSVSVLLIRVSGGVTLAL